MVAQLEKYFSEDMIGLCGKFQNVEIEKALDDIAASSTRELELFDKTNKMEWELCPCWQKRTLRNELPYQESAGDVMPWNDHSINPGKRKLSKMPVPGLSGR
ncbi:hypothetical protein MMC28_002902 [Mycoblastus sanguinarius]|nr:hypothetical protein [Mycoblastus sanguinarius]